MAFRNLWRVVCSAQKLNGSLSAFKQITEHARVKTFLHFAKETFHLKKGGDRFLFSSQKCLRTFSLDFSALSLFETKIVDLSDGKRGVFTRELIKWGQKAEGTFYTQKP
jgi:hypothetical protein